MPAIYWPSTLGMDTFYSKPHFLGQSCLTSMEGIVLNPNRVCDHFYPYLGLILLKQKDKLERRQCSTHGWRSHVSLEWVPGFPASDFCTIDISLQPTGELQLESLLSFLITYYDNHGAMFLALQPPKWKQQKFGGKRVCMGVLCCLWGQREIMAEVLTFILSFFPIICLFFYLDKNVIFTLSLYKQKQNLGLTIDVTTVLSLTLPP